MNNEIENTAKLKNVLLAEIERFDNQQNEEDEE